MKRLWILWLAPVLVGCSLVTITDPYGNRYGDYYNLGDQYIWQLSTCEQEMAAQPVPPHQRKLAMRCCMWRHGVPIDDAASCAAAG